MEHNHENAPICCEHEAHHDIIDQIILPEDEHFFDLAEFFDKCHCHSLLTLNYIYKSENCQCVFCRNYSPKMIKYVKTAVILLTAA